MSASPKSVLAIDKDPAICRLLSLVLGERGFTVYTAPSVPEALDLCRQHQPSVALVELDLSSGRDLQFLADLKAAAPAMSLCVVNASGGSHTVEQLRALGVAHFFPKPFTLVRLVTILEGLAAGAKPPTNGSSFPIC